MIRNLVYMGALLFIGLSQTPSEVTAGSPPLILELSENGQPQRINVVVTVDGKSYEDYLSEAVTSIFRFADCDSDGTLSDQELKFVPAAKSVRQSLSSGFAVPVAPSPSLPEITSADKTKASEEDLRNYYVSHRAVGPVVGRGLLTNSWLLSTALIRELDRNRDGQLDESELLQSDTRLQHLDVNDDGLIGVGELLPNATYPGNWATHILGTREPINISSKPAINLTLQKIAEPVDSGQSEQGAQTVSWKIDISDQIRLSPLVMAGKSRTEAWEVPNTSRKSLEQLREEILSADSHPSATIPSGQRRNQKPSREWLIPLVDRDGNGEASIEEIDLWLTVQKKLAHGQLLISIFHGGGLFELLDSNHDAALSIRELRTAWPKLEAASCTTDQIVDLQRIPEVLFFVVSQGTLSHLSKPLPASPEWFHPMDRNADGDVSRREFTGSLDAFMKMDLDQDGLLSPTEALR